jgi:multiple antibiotic resistance protein
MEFLAGVARASIALFIIVDPLGLIPIFIALTYDRSPDERRAILSNSVLVGFALLVVFTFTGTGILNLFGITLSDLRIAGGILLLVLALHIIIEAHYGQDTGVRPGVVPLAIPLLVGPGAITTTIVFIQSYGLWVTLTAVTLTLAVSFGILRYVGFFYKILGKTGSDVIAKIMGMLLAAIAVQFIRLGLQEIFHF